MFYTISSKEKIYLEYLKTTNGKKLDFIFNNTLNRDSISINKNLRNLDSSPHNILVKPIIQENFTPLLVAKSERRIYYFKKDNTEKYDCTSFYDVNIMLSSSDRSISKNKSS